MENAVHAIRGADTLIVGGTSLAVYPAAGLLRYFRGENLVVINKQPTPADAMANLLIHAPIGRTLDPDAPLKCRNYTKIHAFFKKGIAKRRGILL